MKRYTVVIAVLSIFGSTLADATQEEVKKPHDAQCGQCHDSEVGRQSGQTIPDLALLANSIQLRSVNTDVQLLDKKLLTATFLNTKVSTDSRR